MTSGSMRIVPWVIIKKLISMTLLWGWKKTLQGENQKKMVFLYLFKSIFSFSVAYAHRSSILKSWSGSEK